MHTPRHPHARMRTQTNVIRTLPVLLLIMNVRLITFRVCLVFPSPFSPMVLLFVGLAVSYTVFLESVLTVLYAERTNFWTTALLENQALSQPPMTFRHSRNLNADYRLCNSLLLVPVLSHRNQVLPSYRVSLRSILILFSVLPLTSFEKSLFFPFRC